MSKVKKKKITVSLNWKTAVLAAILVLIFAAAIAQFLFNRQVRWELNQLGTFQTRSLIVDALEGLTDIKKKPDEQMRVPEVRLQLPPETDTVKDLLYVYSEPGEGWTESIQITTRDITAFGISQLNGTDIKELFNRVPEAQACNRGFTIHVNQNQDYSTEDLVQVNDITLNDGRKIYIWREKKCGSNEPNTDKGMRYEAMDELENYLSQITSY